MTGEQNVQKKREAAVFSQAAIIGQPPKITRLDGELQNERVFGYFVRGTRGIVRRWQDLNPGTLPSPRTGHAEAAEAKVAPDLQRPLKKRLCNLLADPLPFSGIKGRSRLYRVNLFLAKGERNAALRASEG
jgi:hypothetical protein